jgi:hypothetical protein
MYGFQIELNESGNEVTVSTLPESRCGDFPECHDEDNPCGCPA